jgi:hypothetical protein
MGFDERGEDARACSCADPSCVSTGDVTVSWVDLLQWPAMLVTVAAAYFVASQSAGRRSLGFWLFMASNALWIAWGWYASAAALVVLQVALAILNIRGAMKNRAADRPVDAARESVGPLREGEASRLSR